MATQSGLQLTDIQSAQAGLTRDDIATRANQVVAQQPSGSITSDVLSGNPKPLTLPPPTVQTLTTGTQDYIASQNESIKTAQQQELDQMQKSLASQKDDILGLIEGIGNSQGIKNDLYKKEGVDKAKKEVDEFTSRLEAEQHSNRRRIEAIQKNPEGLFAGGMEQEVNRVNSESLTKQADLAILQNNALRRYSTAAEIADRAVEAKLEPMKAKLEGLKFFYAENKADFDKKDDRAYAEMIKKQERDYLTQKENITKAFSSGLRNKFINEGGKIYRASDGKEYATPQEFFADAGVNSFEDAYSKGLVGDLTFERVADLDAVMKLRADYADAGISITDTYQEAVDKLAFSNKYLKETESSGGLTTLKGSDGTEYIQDPATGEWYTADDIVGANTGGETQLSQKELKDIDLSTEGKALKTLADLKSAIVQYDALIGQEGFALTGAGRQKLDALYADLKVKWKEAAALGALTGPDLELIEQAVPAATGFGRLNPFERPENVRATLSQTIAGIDRNARGKYDQLVLRNGRYENSPYVRTLGTPFGLVEPTQDTGENFTGPVAPGGNQVKGWSGGQAQAEPLAYLDAQKVQPLPTKSGGVSVSPSVSKVFPPNSVGGQCGVWVRKVVNKFGATYPSLGDSLKSKIAAVKKYGTSLANAKIGSVIVTRENPTYGHVAYIVGRNAKGWIVGESNYKQSNKVSYGRVIPFNSPKLVGVINPTRRV